MSASPNTLRPSASSDRLPPATTDHPLPTTETPKKWRKTFVKVAAWATAEVMVNVVGLDTIADYAEFVSQNQIIANLSETIAHWITLV